MKSLRSILSTALGIALIVGFAMAIILAAMALFRDGNQYAALLLMLGSAAVAGWVWGVAERARD